jgi:hypothetical protein
MPCRHVGDWISALDRGEWSASRPDRFISGQRASSTYQKCDTKCANMVSVFLCQVVFATLEWVSRCLCMCLCSLMAIPVN